MLDFYTIVVVIALVALVLVLIVVGIMMQKQDDDKPFPAYAAKCPDGWAIDANGCKVPESGHPNKGNYEVIANEKTLYDDITGGQSIDGHSDIADKHLLFKDSATRCDKRKWARDAKVAWDGISNYNKCTS
jgi:hypothetical protein